MRAAARLALALPASALLAWAIADAARLGIAEQATLAAAGDMASWADRDDPPSRPMLEDVEARLDGALARAPDLATAHELLARIALRRTDRPDAFERAAGHFGRAIAARPSSPYPWAGLAEAKYRAGDTGAGFEGALVHAARLGPSEPEVERAVEDLGLAAWDSLGAEGRQAVQRMMRNAMRRDPVEVLQIARRRGRLAVACAQRDAVPRRSSDKRMEPCTGGEAGP